jgi:hypothetical protein
MTPKLESMKTFNYLIVLSFFITTTASGQQKESSLLGDWFRVQKTKVQKLDTLLFFRTSSDSTFRAWKFSDPDVLIISSGYETKQKNQPGSEKLYTTLESERFSWKLDKSTRLVTVTNSRKYEQYKILELSDDKLILARTE